MLPNYITVQKGEGNFWFENITFSIRFEVVPLVSENVPSYTCRANIFKLSMPYFIIVITEICISCKNQNVFEYYFGQIKRFCGTQKKMKILKIDK